MQVSYGTGHIEIDQEGSFMICPNCQAEMPEGMKFCSSCGTPLAAPVAEAVNDAAAQVQQVAEDVPSASFDPGAPIAVPKQKEVVPEVSSDIPEVVPEVAPIEEVVPEFSQIDQAPIVEPAVAVAPIPVSAPAPAPAPVSTPAPVALNPETMAAPVYSSNTNPYPAPVTEELNPDADQKPLKTGTAFFLMLLFAIPVVGLISSIILSAAGKKCKSRKSFARAVLIWKILLIILALSLCIVVYFMFNEIFEAAMSGDVEELVDAVKDAFDL